MLSRKEQTVTPNEFPESWTNQVVQTLNEVYSGQFNSETHQFDIFAFTYPDEVFLAISLVSKVDLAASPVTYMASADLTEKSKPQDIIDTLIDSSGIFFDDHFGGSESQDYLSNWTEAEYKKFKFFYKVSRENLRLTIEANKLLNE